LCLPTSEAFLKDGDFKIEEDYNERYPLSRCVDAVFFLLPYMIGMFFLCWLLDLTFIFLMMVMPAVLCKIAIVVFNLTFLIIIGFLEP
jgi:hypothetical protein